MNGAERRAFVRGHRTAVFGYARKADGPSMSVCYYVMDGDDILVSTMIGRAKAKAVRRGPKVSLCILDEHWPPTYLLVYGDAAIEEQGGDDLLIRICELMGRRGDAGTRARGSSQAGGRGGRVTVRIKPYATFETPPRHVYNPDDVKTLTHGYGATLPWDTD